MHPSVSISSDLLLPGLLPNHILGGNISSSSIKIIFNNFKACMFESILTSFEGCAVSLNVPFPSHLSSGKSLEI